MPLPSFVLYTTIGSGVWNALLIEAGWLLGDNWELVSGYQKLLGNVVRAALALAVVWFVGRRLLVGKSGPGAEGAEPGAGSRAS